MNLTTRETPQLKHPIVTALSREDIKALHTTFFNMLAAFTELSDRDVHIVSYILLGALLDVGFRAE